MLAGSISYVVGAPTVTPTTITTQVYRRTAAGGEWTRCGTTTAGRSEEQTGIKCGVPERLVAAGLPSVVCTRWGELGQEREEAVRLTITNNCRLAGLSGVSKPSIIATITSSSSVSPGSTNAQRWSTFHHKYNLQSGHHRMRSSRRLSESPAASEPRSENDLIRY